MTVTASVELEAHMTDSDTKREMFLDRTIEVWQSTTSRALTREDARTIVENMTGFFELLLKWERLDGRDKAIAERPSQSPSDDDGATRV